MKIYPRNIIQIGQKYITVSNLIYTIHAVYDCYYDCYFSDNYNPGLKSWGKRRLKSDLVKQILEGKMKRYENTSTNNIENW
jgi:hypothetical protein